MKSQIFEEASKVIPDPQILINVVSKRVKQLNSGSRPLVEVHPSMGVMEIALAEIAQRKIGFTKQSNHSPPESN